VPHARTPHLAGATGAPRQRRATRR
jgi:hypothetical protein